MIKIEHPANSRGEAFGVRSGSVPLQAALLGLILLAVIGRAAAEDGYDLWLRYLKVDDPVVLSAYRKKITSIVAQGKSEIAQAIQQELRRGLEGLLGKNIPIADSPPGPGAILVGTPEDSFKVARLGWGRVLKKLGPEGYRIHTAQVDGYPVWVIASQGERGVLYGVFHLLRLLQTHRALDRLECEDKPAYPLRMLDHWDNLDGSIERGYAGKSLWRWKELPERVDARLTDYARACASIGLNGVVLNNVNTDPRILTRDYLVKAAAVAGAFRPYGLRLYLSANFGSPKALGEWPTADPLDPGVGKWWKEKADEIYSLIPDFGGFLVKANSEGQPGPQDYGRTQAQGANMLARALAPHGGSVLWRAFVYSPEVDPDRIKRAYKEFIPLDGQFLPNVLVQVKNGPLDFQPREPFHPLFGAMKQTPLMAELQVTQEYLGQSTHLVYLAPMWKEFLDSDTHAPGPETLVRNRVRGMAGVANTGDDRNWCGHPFAPANWYAFGRLAWNPSLKAEDIAEEWIRMTWGNDPDLVRTLIPLMMGSREIFANYSSPLGLNGMYGGDHYSPMPWSVFPGHEDWSSPYFHRAALDGLGYDRTRQGSDAVDQYYPPLNDLWNDLATCPEEYLLWFHRLSWNYRLKSGLTLWEGLCQKYGEGARGAREMEGLWGKVKGKVDAERFGKVEDKLRQQARDAQDWRDACLGYFQTFSHQPIRKDGEAVKGGS